MLHLRLGDRDIENDDLLSTRDASQPFSLGWEGEGNLHTVVMYDMDSPYPYPDDTNSPYLHLMIVNVPGIDMNSGTFVMDYVPPQPPTDSVPHRYIVEVYRQTGEVTPPTIGARENFDLSLIPEGDVIGRKIFRVWAYSGPISISEDKRKFCSCVIQVAAKQTESCLAEKKWRQKEMVGAKSVTCYNPYAVCAKSVGTTSRECGRAHEFAKMPEDQLIAYAHLHRIPIPSGADKEVLLNAVYDWKAQQGEV